jgi:hypothetical protein
MSSSTMLTVAGASCVVGAAVAAVILMRRMINATVFPTMICKLVTAGHPERAVKLCRAAPGAPSAAMALYMLGLVVPAESFDEAHGGFRDAPRSRSFEERVNDLVTRQLRALQRRQTLPALVGAALGLIALLLAVSAWILVPPADDTWRTMLDVVAGAGLVVAAGCVVYRRRINDGIAHVAKELRPLLRPAEQLDDPARAAAEEAQRYLARTPFA